MWINKILTKNYTEVPLFLCLFDLNKYNKFGSKNSCVIQIHPSIKNDLFLHKKMEEIVDYIRNNYDMNEITR